MRRRREGFSACVVHGLFNELALHRKSQLCSRVPLGDGSEKGIRTSSLTKAVSPCRAVVQLHQTETGRSTKREPNRESSTSQQIRIWV